MSLDVHVMPIWKFKAGGFSSPLEALGIMPVRIGPDGMRRMRESRIGFVDRWQAKRATRSLRREIELEIGHLVQWNDKGDSAYSQQAQGFEALRAFARWLDHRDVLPTFDPPPEENYYKHPVLFIDVQRPLTYEHVVKHSCYSGYFIPAELERVVYVEPFRSWGSYEFKHSVGSSFQLLNELQKLSDILEVKEAYSWNPDDPLRDVKAAFVQLHEVAKISCRKNLPIGFDG